MIQSFADEKCRRFFCDEYVPAKWRSFKSIAARKLDMLDAASRIEDLTKPPGNRLDRLKGNRVGQYSIRINDQWRVCFKWSNSGPFDVEIVDYH